MMFAPLQTNLMAPASTITFGNFSSKLVSDRKGMYIPPILIAVKPSPVMIAASSSISCFTRVFIFGISIFHWDDIDSSISLLSVLDSVYDFKLLPFPVLYRASHAISNLQSPYLLLLGL